MKLEHNIWGKYEYRFKVPSFKIKSLKNDTYIEKDRKNYPLPLQHIKKSINIGFNIAKIFNWRRLV